jgi:hypothetical protein
MKKGASAKKKNRKASTSKISAEKYGQLISRKIIKAVGCLWQAAVGY